MASSQTNYRYSSIMQTRFQARQRKRDTEHAQAFYWNEIKQCGDCSGKADECMSCTRKICNQHLDDHVLYHHGHPWTVCEVTMPDGGRCGKAIMGSSVCAKHSCSKP